MCNTHRHTVYERQQQILAETFLQHLYIYGLQTPISRFVAVLCKDLSMVLTKPIVNFYQHETVFDVKL